MKCDLTLNLNNYCLQKVRPMENIMTVPNVRRCRKIISNNFQIKLSQFGYDGHGVIINQDKNRNHIYLLSDTIEK